MSNPFDDMVFAGNPLDRLSELRGDEAALARLDADENARAVVFAGLTPLLRPAGVGFSALHPFEEVRGLGAIRHKALLGRDAFGPVQALMLTEDCLEPVAEDPGSFVDQRHRRHAGRPELIARDLRALGWEGALPRAEIAMLAQARAVLNWHESHAFCARCGGKTESTQAGWRRDCPSCGAQHFPRTDPVVIVLVTQGESCLMGRQKNFPPGMYSCLAGFVEGGETIEEAARREIFEESGVRIGVVDVLASQPWPFPSSLMIGCRAQALSRDIVLDVAELEDCRWFSRDEARAMIAGEHVQGFQAPKPVAIARRLLDLWLN